MVLGITKVAEGLLIAVIFLLFASKALMQASTSGDFSLFNWISLF